MCDWQAAAAAAVMAGAGLDEAISTPFVEAD